jgi:hypothetical protein
MYTKVNRWRRLKVSDPARMVVANNNHLAQSVLSAKRANRTVSKMLFIPSSFWRKRKKTHSLEKTPLCL